MRLRRAVKGYLERAAMVRHPTEFPEDAALGHLHNSSYDINAAVEQLPGLGAPHPLAARHHEAPPRPTLTFVGARAAGSLLPDTKQLDLWTKPDVLKFEEGVVRHGKNFEKIHKLMEGKYPVSQLVLFYFARWKKQPNYKVWQSRCAEFGLPFVAQKMRTGGCLRSGGKTSTGTSARRAARAGCCSAATAAPPPTTPPAATRLTPTWIPCQTAPGTACRAKSGADGSNA